MSDKADSPSGELEIDAREGSVGQEEVTAAEETKSAFSFAEIVGNVDSFFPDAENVTLESIIAARNQLQRQRNALVQSVKKVKEDAVELGKQQETALETARQMAAEVATAVQGRPLLEQNDFGILGDALQRTCSDSRKAVYFITLWLIKRLDQKLEKLFALKKTTPANPLSHNAPIIWDDRVALGTYLELLDIAVSIQSSACKNLATAAAKTAEFWFKQLLDQFSKDFSTRLEAIRYPFSTGMQPVPKNFTKSPLPLELEGLTDSVRLLLELQPPPSWKPSPDSEVISTFANVAAESSDRFGQILISELTSPMSRRFRFHFYGKRPTNTPEHPEWYHTQILSWLESNGLFVRALFTDACVAMNLEKEQRTEYVDLLYNSWALVILRLAVEKLSLDLPALLETDVIFAHLVDETLLFHNSVFTFLAKQNVTKVDIDPLRLLIASGVFDRWMDVEKKFALTRIDAFLSKSDALTISEKAVSDAASSKDVVLAPTCVVDFVSLISGLLDRCDIIMTTSMQSTDSKQLPFCQFLAMVLNLVDGFRIRLLQLGRSCDALSSRGLALLAAAGHLEDAISVDWIHRPVVVFAKQALANGPKTVPKLAGDGEIPPGQDFSIDFTDQAALFTRAVRELADNVLGALEMELTKACVCAAEDHQSESGEEQSSHVVITVAHCAGIALHNLLDRLRLGLGGFTAIRRLVGTRLATCVDTVLFSQIFERLSNRRTVLAQVIAKELDEFIRTRVVYLLTRHISPTAQPVADRLLPRMIDALHLLTSVPEPVARLLRSTLTMEGASQAEMSNSLEEIGCRTFAKTTDGPKLALLLLNIRFGAAV